MPTAHLSLPYWPPSLTPPQEPVAMHGHFRPTRRRPSPRRAPDRPGIGIVVRARRWDTQGWPDSVDWVQPPRTSVTSGSWDRARALARGRPPCGNGASSGEGVSWPSVSHVRRRSTATSTTTQPGSPPCAQTAAVDPAARVAWEPRCRRRDLGKGRRAPTAERQISTSFVPRSVEKHHE